MPDLALHCRLLQDIIKQLDPKRDEVAACHLQDALDALQATLDGETTRYTRNDTIVRGVVWLKQNGAAG